MVAVLLGYAKDVVLADNARVKHGALLQCCNVPAQEKDAVGQTSRASELRRVLPICHLGQALDSLRVPSQMCAVTPGSGKLQESVLTCKSLRRKVAGLPGVLQAAGGQGQPGLGAAPGQPAQPCARAFLDVPASADRRPRAGLRCQGARHQRRSPGGQRAGDQQRALRPVCGPARPAGRRRRLQRAGLADGRPGLPAQRRRAAGERAGDPTPAWISGRLARGSAGWQPPSAP